MLFHSDPRVTLEQPSLVLHQLCLIVYIGPACRFLNYFFDNLEYPAVEEFCKVRSLRLLCLDLFKQQSAEISQALPPARLAFPNENAFKLKQSSARFQACLACKGAILFTGIGKSGFIAQKVCQTLVSTGTKAVFLSPTDALHGDIGILSREDLLVLVSKSGATDELLRLVPYARVRRGLAAPVW